MRPIKCVLFLENSPTPSLECGQVQVQVVRAARHTNESAPVGRSAAACSCRRAQNSTLLSWPLSSSAFIYFLLSPPLTGPRYAQPEFNQPPPVCVDSHASSLFGCVKFALNGSCGWGSAFSSTRDAFTPTPQPHIDKPQYLFHQLFQLQPVLTVRRLKRNAGLSLCVLIACLSFLSPSAELNYLPFLTSACLHFLSYVCTDIHADVRMKLRAQLSQQASEKLLP